MMKSKLFRFCAVLLFTWASYEIHAQGVGINTTGSSPDPSALLDVSGTTSGVLINRMSTAQMEAIQNPANGLIVYNTDCNSIYINTGQPESPEWTALNPIAPSISISASQQGAICAGASNTYTAVVFNEGSNPVYQWKVNGSDVGSNTPQYTYTPSNGDMITCTLTSDAECLSQPSAVSNPLYAFTASTESPALSYNNSPYCGGSGFAYPTLTGPAGGTYGSEPTGLSINTSTGAVDLSLSAGGTYTVTYIAPGGCAGGSAVASITIQAPSTGTQTYAANGGTQTFEVPTCVTSLTIEAYGAQGGSVGGVGGKGAYMKGTVPVTPGATLNIMVGMQGGTDGNGGGGGGGSFVWTGGLQGLIVAAAGGGGGGWLPDVIGGDGQATTSTSVGLPGGTGAGGINGNGGNGGSLGTNNNASSAGGAGWISNGGSGVNGGYTAGGGGYSPLNGGAGGSAGTVGGTMGGFGGGGGAARLSGGGGGGYNGGGGGNGLSDFASGGGGGGSFIAANATNTGDSASGVRSGNGQVIITW